MSTNHFKRPMSHATTTTSRGVTTELDGRGHLCGLEISRPREATSANSTGPSLPQSPGGHYVHDRRRLLDVLLDGLLNSMWELADHDRRMAADDLEYAAAYLQDASEDDRKRARERREREREA